ncbi:Proteinase inhibitor I4, serpin [Crocosphaera chwakensis CCY0110]|uniref:Proteinase inhibitor I4, serpin n=1 Tax=Crocosphaera chwakensis CCY0110 TaxID=391612 RepID=A3IWZ5_9CHRO|nr:Proteinase inhibitor I4, serpin [Crocosphaera chwakensis CCY0110]
MRGLHEVSPRMIFPQPTLQEKQLVDAQVEFGFKLFSTLTKNQKPQNIFISPTSIALTLSMLYNGATGTTQKEIARGLSFHDISVDTLNRGNQMLQHDLNSHPSYGSLAITHSLWAREGFSFRYQFLKDSRSYYQAQITNLDFASSEAQGIMNRWITEETQGEIQTIVDSTQADDVLFLINTASFQGFWKTGFDRNLIKDKPFYITDTSVKIFPFMSREGIYNFLETPQLKAIELPYDNDRFSLYLFLPKPEYNLSKMVEKLTAEKLSKLLSKFRKTQALLELPRFRLNYEVDLTESLKSLGFSTMFDPAKAEFSELSSHPTYVNGLKHQTLLVLDEQGIKPATPNNFVVETASVDNVVEKSSFIVDRPFFSIIRDNQTGNILFMGVIVEP